MSASTPGGGGAGPFDDLFRLQSDFQARLAEETVRYLRKLQGLVGPVVPGTIVMSEDAGAAGAEGVAGEQATLHLEVRNRQRVHSMVTPMLGPLVGVSGVTWYPEAECEPASLLLAPDEVKAVAVRVRMPRTLPAGIYRGALVLYGFRDGGVPVSVTVRRARAGAARGKKTARRAVAGAGRTRGAGVATGEAEKTEASKTAAKKKTAGKKTGHKQARPRSGGGRRRS